MFFFFFCLFFKAVSAQDEKLAQTMFLPLAERMVEKMVKEEKIEAEAEVSRKQEHIKVLFYQLHDLRQGLKL